MPEPTRYSRLVKWLGSLSVILILAAIVIHYLEKGSFLTFPAWFGLSFIAFIVCFILAFVFFTGSESFFGEELKLFRPRPLFVFPQESEFSSSAFMVVATFAIGTIGLFKGVDKNFLSTAIKSPKSAIELKMEDTSWSISGRVKYAILVDDHWPDPDTLTIKNEDKLATYTFNDSAEGSLTKYFNYAIKANNANAKPLIPSLVEKAIKVQDCIDLVTKAIKPPVTKNVINNTKR